MNVRKVYNEYNWIFFFNWLGELKDTCYRCLKKGHIKKECPLSRTPSPNNRKNRRSNHQKRYERNNNIDEIVIEIKKEKERDLVHLPHIVEVHLQIHPDPDPEIKEEIIKIRNKKKKKS